MICSSDKDVLLFSLSPGSAGDAPEGRKLIEALGEANRITHLLMDLAYEGGETRTLAFELGYNPVVPPKSNRKNPRPYSKVLYRMRNQVERLFRRIKQFRRIFTRYDKLDSVFLFFVFFALVYKTI
jgi:transposase